jgi:hypothetical protein
MKILTVDLTPPKKVQNLATEAERIPDQYDVDLDIVEAERIEIPIRLAVAIENLVDLARTGSENISQCFLNDGPQNFLATRVALRLCRAALADIESIANVEAVKIALWHGDVVAQWEATEVIAAP